MLALSGVVRPGEDTVFMDYSLPLLMDKKAAIQLMDLKSELIDPRILVEGRMRFLAPVLLPWRAVSPYESTVDSFVQRMAAQLDKKEVYALNFWRVPSIQVQHGAREVPELGEKEAAAANWSLDPPSSDTAEGQAWFEAALRSEEEEEEEEASIGERLRRLKRADVEDDDDPEDEAAIIREIQLNLLAEREDRMREEYRARSLLAFVRRHGGTSRVVLTLPPYTGFFSNSNFAMRGLNFPEKVIRNYQTTRHWEEVAFEDLSSGMSRNHGHGLYNDSPRTIYVKSDYLTSSEQMEFYSAGSVYERPEAHYEMPAPRHTSADVFFKFGRIPGATDWVSAPAAVYPDDSMTLAAEFLNKDLIGPLWRSANFSSARHVPVAARHGDRLRIEVKRGSPELHALMTFRLSSLAQRYLRMPSRLISFDLDVSSARRSKEWDLHSNPFPALQQYYPLTVAAPHCTTLSECGKSFLNERGEVAVICYVDSKGKTNPVDFVLPAAHHRLALKFYDFDQKPVIFEDACVIRCALKITKCL